ncbi:MAG: ribosomal RNA small subunit methyltransferase A [Candidatus Parcubacteria bacterium]|nr:MAG: ribosomal RNA small subunit methyltransferase A [Candidatus Parcubacteria bacterium]
MKKALGQNFLKNRLFLKEISNNLTIKAEDIIIEIGGGHGELTQFLLKAKKLIVYEIDKNLAEILKNKFKNFQNVEIVNENFLKADLKKFNHQYKLVGNIPYRITGLILRKILTLDNFPQVFVFTLQKEVGEKILANNNFLSHWIKIWGKVEKIDFIKNKYFWPQPKVDSVTLKIKFYSQPLVKEPEAFAQFLRSFFKHPRRMLKNNLDLPQNFNHLANLRPHQVSFEKIIEIYQNYI